jgi:hypothetical protein
MGVCRPRPHTPSSSFTCVTFINEIYHKNACFGNLNFSLGIKYKNSDGWNMHHPSLHLLNFDEKLATA